MGQALARVPALETAGIKQLINGPESFTPDGNFILGEAPELGNFYVGAGFNAFGIASGGGAGKRSEEHTSELQSLMRISYAVFCLKKKKKHIEQTSTTSQSSLT